MRAWTSFLLWFNRYIWRFKGGKAGTFTLLLALALDMHSRVEILARWIHAMIAPLTVAIVTSGWFHLGLVVTGLVLIYRSSAEGKITPVPKTPEERLEDSEQRIVKLESDQQTTLAGLRKTLDLQSEFAATNGKLHDNFAERIAGLEHDRTKATEERYAIGARITSEVGSLTSDIEGSKRHADFIDGLIQQKLVPRLDAIDSRLNEHRPWISELERRLVALERADSSPKPPSAAV